MYKTHLLIGDRVKHLFHLLRCINLCGHSVGGVECVLIHGSEPHRQEQITLQTSTGLDASACSTLKYVQIHLGCDV